MARNGLCVVVCAALAAGLSVAPLAARDPELRIHQQLRVQKAFSSAESLLKDDKFQAAVTVLEKHVPYIDGNRKYLELLREAYRGHVKELTREGRLKDAELYRGRLSILEPGLNSPLPSKALPTKPLPLVALDLPKASLPPPAIGRAKVEDKGAGDPFDSRNSTPEHARDMLDKAERAFSDRDYDKAHDLFNHADRADDKLLAPEAKKRWAYCRLFRVALAIKQAGGAPVPAMEAEIRTAVETAATPELEKWGRDLLQKAREGDEPAIAIKHTPRQGNGWALAETANFRVYHQMPTEQAEKVVRVAESTRVRMIRNWFAEEPADWSPRCDLVVYPDAASYARNTKAPEASPGHASVKLDSGRVVVRRLDLRADHPNMIKGVLPHEATHVVLAGRFGRHHVPRWADEGMAVLSEPRDLIQLHLRNLPTFQREGKLFPVASLVKQADYPDGKLIGTFYAQSISVVEFLVKKKDGVTFTRFVRTGLDGGYEAALERYYGYRSFAEMERDWFAATFGGAPVASKSEKRN